MIVGLAEDNFKPRVRSSGSKGNCEKEYGESDKDDSGGSFAGTVRKQNAIKTLG